MRNDPQENTQRHVEHWPVALHEVTQALWHGQYPLAHRQAGEDVVREVRRRLHHEPRVARGADAPALAGEGYEVVVSAIVAPGSGKAVREDAAFQIFAKGLADIGLWRVVVALPVELAGAGQLKPGLEVLGNGLVEQRALWMARVVEFGFGARWPARVRMRVRLS